MSSLGIFTPRSMEIQEMLNPARNTKQPERGDSSFAGISQILLSQSNSTSFPSRQTPAVLVVVEKPPQGKNDCGAFAVPARNTSLVGRQTPAPHSRETLIHQSGLIRDETPPSSRVGALARRIEGEPGRIGSASKGSAPSIQTLLSQSRLTFGGYSG